MAQESKKKDKKKLSSLPSDFSVKFGLLNGCSITNSTDLFVDIVDNYKLDLVALTETWLKADDDIIMGEMCPW